MSARSKAWSRQHDDASLTVVERLAGTFVALYTQTPQKRRPPEWQLSGFVSAQDACAAADEEVRRHGHHCSERCGEWLTHDF